MDLQFAPAPDPCAGELQIQHASHHGEPGL